MLKQRVITALVLVSVFMAALFFLPWYVFAAVVGLFFMAGSWEWANLAGLLTSSSRFLYVACIAAVAFSLGWFLDWASSFEYLQTILLINCFWWGIAVLWIQGYPSSAVLWQSRLVRMVMGALVLIPAWLACLYLINQPQGVWLIMFVVFLVAAADIGAYFSGKAFGRRKLAPNVSPGKSWEGVIGGALFAMLLAAAFNVIFGWQSWLSLLAIVLPTALISVVGDLLESMVKRHRGVKDSSQLLPGHGGVLDRIDGLVAAAPIFALGLMSTQWQLV